MNDIIEVYHSGIETVNKPDIFHSRPNLDFGPGFYLTDIYEQAVTWAIKRSKLLGGNPVVNKYLLSRKELLNGREGKSLIFEEYDEKWFDFVIQLDFYGKTRNFLLILHLNSEIQFINIPKKFH